MGRKFEMPVVAVCRDNADDVNRMFESVMNRCGIKIKPFYVVLDNSSPNNPFKVKKKLKRALKPLLVLDNTQSLLINYMEIMTSVLLKIPEHAFRRDYTIQWLLDNLNSLTEERRAQEFLLIDPSAELKNPIDFIDKARNYPIISDVTINKDAAHTELCPLIQYFSAEAFKNYKIRYFNYDPDNPVFNEYYHSGDYAVKSIVSEDVPFRRIESSYYVYLPEGLSAVRELSRADTAPAPIPGAHPQAQGQPLQQEKGHQVPDAGIPAPGCTNGAAPEPVTEPAPEPVTEPASEPEHEPAHEPAPEPQASNSEHCARIETAAQTVDQNTRRLDCAAVQVYPQVQPVSLPSPAQNAAGQTARETKAADMQATDAAECTGSDSKTECAGSDDKAESVPETAADSYVHNAVQKEQHFEQTEYKMETQTLNQTRGQDCSQNTDQKSDQTRAALVHAGDNPAVTAETEKYDARRSDRGASSTETASAEKTVPVNVGVPVTAENVDPSKPAESDPDPDLLYVLGTGSLWGNNEIKFSLRSVEQFGKNYGRVLVVGPVLPKFFDCKKVVHLKYQDSPEQNGWKNQLDKVLYAIKTAGLSKKFVFMMDDVFLTAPTDFRNYPVYFKGQLTNDPSSKNKWRISKNRTLDILKKMNLPIKDFELHSPIVYDQDMYRETAEELIKIAGGKGIFPQPRSFYCNRYGIQGVRYEDLKLRGKHLPKGPASVDPLIKGRTYFSISDEALIMGVARYLKKMYPHKSRWETAD